MVSNLKSETARINGAKSRGPTTIEGKEKSSRNAITHGLTAGNGNILLDCEDSTQFDEVLNKLLGIHEPATPAEQDLVEEMVAARWRTRRMWTIETGLLNAEVLAQAAKTDNPDPSVHLASAFHSLADDSRSLALASRYEARLQRLYDRAYKTLRELQQVRKSQEPTPHQNIRIKWVNPEEEMETPHAQETHSPSVSEEAKEEPQPAPETELRKEPTDVTNNEVNDQPAAMTPTSCCGLSLVTKPLISNLRPSDPSTGIRARVPERQPPSIQAKKVVGPHARI
jgi:hypothetical protein